MKIESYKVLSRFAGISGFQRIYRFPNGYGASVVDGRSLHSYPFYTEIAVIMFKGDSNDKFDLVYDTPVTNDVIITDGLEDETNYLEQIKNL